MPAARTRPARTRATGPGWSASPWRTTPGPVWRTPGPVTAPAPGPPGAARLLLRLWLVGLLSATGIGCVRGTVHSVVSGGGGLAGAFLLVGTALSVSLQIPAAALAAATVRRVRPGAAHPLAVAVAVLVLGGVGTIALNRVLVSGEGFLPPFGPVSLLLLCAPSPLVFLMLVVRCARPRLCAAAAALALAGVAVPLRTGQEHLAGHAWRADHQDTAPSLLQAVDWPGGEQSPLRTGSFGTRVTVFFQSSNIDGTSDGVVTVSPAATDPCARLSVIADDDTAPDRDPDDGTETVDVPVVSCTPVGPHAWSLEGPGFTGYAERRDGVLVRIAVDGLRQGDDLPVLAATLHPLDDHALWRYLGATPDGWWWLLS